MPETVIDLGKKVKSKYPGQYDDLADADVGRKVKAKFPGAYDDFADVDASAHTSAPAATQTNFERAREFQQTPLYQQTIGVSPIELVKRLKGAARVVGKTGMGAVQYAQHLVGAKVSPTPLVLEPTADPNEEIGAKLGEAVLTAAPAIATSGASLPVQAAVGSTVGGIQAGPAGAVVGGGIPVAGKAIGAGVEKLGKWAQEKELAAKLWNRVANVKGGQGGNQLDIKTGKFKTLPGRSMVDESQGPLSQVKEAFLAKPSAATQIKARMEFGKAGDALKAELRKATTPIDVVPHIPLDNAKAQFALKQFGINNPAGLKRLSLSPEQTHALRREIGDSINWNPNVYHEANERLKETYFALGKELERVLPTSIKPFMKTWQESHLFNKALASKMEKAASQPVPKWVNNLLKAGAIGAAGAAGASALMD